MVQPFIAMIALGVLALFPLAAIAQQSSSARPYDGIQAGLDAYRLGEERRRSDFQQQIDVNEGLRAWAGLPSLSGDVMYYGDALRPWYGGFGAGYGYVGPGGYGPGFGPWPYGPGPLWQSQYTTPVRQPIGRWEGQTGPNRWESHPVYDPPITPYRASPPVDSPWLDRTPYAAPRPQVLPWTDGFDGDTDSQPLEPRAKPTAPRPAEPPEPLPPSPGAETDDFDTPRRSRDPVSPPPAPRRTRDF